jgi:hypothetical protein
MAQDNLRHACAAYSKLPAPETVKHLANCLASYQEAALDWANANSKE